VIETIYIKSIGETDKDMIQYLQQELAGIFRRTVSILDPLPIPPQSYDAARQQYLSTELLKALLANTNAPVCVPNIGTGRDEPSKVLGVTEVDLFIPIFTYVFGEAQLNGTAALISLHRLKPDYYEDWSENGFAVNNPAQPHGPEHNRYRLRALKEAVHELGHTFGLVHCTHEARSNPALRDQAGEDAYGRKCVMNFANNVVEVDLKDKNFCPNCLDMIIKT